MALTLKHTAKFLLKKYFFSFNLFHDKLHVLVPITRPDNILQDLRNKIFPFKKRKEKAPVSVSSVLLPARRKERSLSSLVVSTPRVCTQSTMTGRRTKPARKASGLQGSSFSIEKLIKKEEELLEDHQDNSCSPDTSNKSAKNGGQVGKAIRLFSLCSPCHIWFCLLWFIFSLSWFICFP